MAEIDRANPNQKKIYIEAYGHDTTAKKILRGEDPGDAQRYLVEIFSEVAYAYSAGNGDVTGIYTQRGNRHYVPLPFDEYQALLAAHEDVSVINMAYFQESAKQRAAEKETAAAAEQAQQLSDPKP